MSKNSKIYASKLEVSELIFLSYISCLNLYFSSRCTYKIVHYYFYKNWFFLYCTSLLDYSRLFPFTRVTFLKNAAKGAKGRVKTLWEIWFRGTRDLQIMMICKLLTSAKPLVLVLIVMILVFPAGSCQGDLMT